MSENPLSFYNQLPAFDNFLQLSNAELYHQVPDNWTVVLTDIKNSTRAIEAGKYKMINMMGAAAIAAISNTIKTMEYPVVFGGDGATAIIPNEYVEQVKKNLAILKFNAKKDYDLDLRVGLVSLADVTSHGKFIKIAKYKLPGEVHIAFFKGTGLDWAEAEIKSGKYLIEALENTNPAENTFLDGLSCRWAPIDNARGMIMSLLIKEREPPEEMNVISTVLTRLNSFTKLENQEAHPSQVEKLKAENSTRAAELESRMVKKLSFFQVKLIIFLAKIFDFFNIKIEGQTLKQYFKSIPAHSDFKKYDGTLRMILDCSETEKNQIIDYLHSLYVEKKIYYGHFISQNALLTCFVKGQGTGKHIHFVDGNDGGYTMAAKQMKQQMAMNKLQVENKMFSTKN